MPDMEMLVLVLSVSSGTVLFVVMICLIFLCRSGRSTRLRSPSQGRMSIVEDEWEETQTTNDQDLTTSNHRSVKMFRQRNLTDGEFPISSDSDGFSLRSSSLSTLGAERNTRRKESKCYVSEGE